MLYLHLDNDLPRWLEAFQQQRPDLRVVTANDEFDHAEVRWVAAWNPPEGLFARFPKLEAVFALGAGVDAFMRRSDLPETVPLMRLLDAGMAQQMVEYILWAVLTVQRDFDRYQQQQLQQQWQEQTARSVTEMRLGVLGLGALGQQVARQLAGLGYPVTGWKRSSLDLPGVRVLTGDEGFKQLLQTSDVLISLLPNTPATQGMLNADCLGLLPQGAVLVNVARGVQVVDEDLLQLLDNGHLRLAVLDVFHQEPLPADHPFWGHPKVVLTPHVAAATLPEPAITQVLDNLHRLQRGETPRGLVTGSAGY
ncbi:2-hydroxyacid dehydrogenase [Marinospirillum alkaliphilum]|uniref:Glyoxylate/hydroxypyruvate reductase A n=1 Tax=Marinospirillum alkaliphilum DSM 21637 TaxID=1122209 RepID=A0A1K1X7L1_9GAMM|nr:glyoxylate/hydroxypyruvate reductase A [Marinospirillum alkaliphilum]SFX45608.1 glyoxylate/hydroxypyruvate reductase A [Marinospirillum alkaliphilum DSM 21637]